MGTHNEGVIKPSSKATNAPNGLNVEPGGYCPFIALFNKGLETSSTNLL